MVFGVIGISLGLMGRREQKLDFPQSLDFSLSKARRITVLTGAGISAESGIPTFREAQTGLWSMYDPEELATPKAFRNNPELVWCWYQWRKEIINRSEPNPGHLALAEMESIVTQREAQYTLITQNVDGLHQRAGSVNIFELHGNIHRSKCFDCGIIAEYHNDNGEENPHCFHCGGLLRPDVVWFGESLPAFAVHASWEAAQVCDIFFSIGTSAMVQPAASLPIIALQNGATLVEINPHDTAISALAHYCLQGAAGNILPHLIQKVWIKSR